MGRTVARAADTSGSSPFAASRQVSEPKTARVGPTGSSRCSQASPSHGTPEDHAIALSWFPPSRGHQVHFWLGSAGSVGPVADPGAPVEDLLYWLDDFGLGGFSPAEAVLVMNAWPAGTMRQAGEALSDLLEDANCEFFYSAMLAPRRPGTGVRRTVVNVVVFFTYNGLSGVLQMEDTT